MGLQPNAYRDGMRVAGVSGLYAALGGAVTLAGWILDLPRLTDWNGSGISMFVNTAICALLSGLGILVLAFRPAGPRAIPRLLGGAVATIGVLTLAEHVFAVNLGIDTALVSRPWGQAAAASPMRMGPPASLSFALVGVALVLAVSGAPRSRRIASGIGIGAVTIAGLSLVGYLYGAQRLYTRPNVTAIAMQTATMILAIGVGLIAAIPERGLAALVRRDDPGGVLMRRLLLPIVLVPLSLGGLRVLGEDLDLFDETFGVAVLVFAMIACFLGLLAWTAAGLSRADAIRRRQQEALRDSERMHRLLAEIGVIAARTNVPGGTSLDELTDGICRRVAEGLAVSRCGFSRVDLDARVFVIEREHHEGFPSLAGIHPMDDDNAPFVESGLAKRTSVVFDLKSDPRTARRYATAFAPLGLRSSISVPLHRDGRWAANFWVSHHEPRRWTDGEVRLMQTVAERVWLVMEQARVAGALQASEASLQEADRLKDEFLATLAHELRNPLAPVRNAVRFLSIKGSLDPELESAREMIDRQVTHMARLIEDLTDVSRISRGKLTLRRQELDLRDVVRDAVDLARGGFSEKRQALHVVLPEERLWVDGDPVRLGQIVGNVLNNACKYSHSRGRIELRAAREGGDVVLAVRDDGTGIAEEMLPRVFDMFVQADQALERSAGGLGIGLALVRGLVDLHRGSVEARSDGLGKGSEFVIRLPALAEAPSRAELAPADAPVSPSVVQRFLVVDDNLDSATSLALLLKHEGHETHVAYDGVQAVERAEALLPDVVLLDIGLPKLNGYDACRAIRSARPDAPTLIVALTGWGQEDDRRKSQDAGFDGHLVKPVEYTTLCRLLLDLRAKRELSGPSLG